MTREFVFDSCKSCESCPRLLFSGRTNGKRERNSFLGNCSSSADMVPEVGREAISEVRGSIEAMAELTRRIIRSGAETVVIISPHAPLSPDAFVAYQTKQLRGDFANFRAPATTVEFPLDEELLAAITTAAAGENYE